MTKQLSTQSQFVVRVVVGIALSLIAIMSESARSQDSQCGMPLFPAQQFIVNGIPKFLVSGDLQGDGVPDLVICHHSSISVLIGEGNGTFADPVEYESGMTSRSIVIDDLDGDSDLDLVVSNYGNYPDFVGAVSVLLNNGDGTFSDPVAYTYSGTKLFAASEDLDGDGDVDLAIAIHSDPNLGLPDRIVLLKGNGDGTFRNSGVIAVGEYHSFIAIADLDGDGDADLALTNTAINGISILLNNGNGSFAKYINYSVAYDPRSIFIDDLNGDGHADLAIASRSSDNVSVLLGIGDGTFNTPSFYPAPGAKFISIDDLDHDGDKDLAVVVEDCTGGANDHCIAVFLNNGDGTFGIANNIFAGLNPAVLTIDDYDGDADADLAVMSDDSASRTVTLLLGHGDGTFDSPTMYDWGLSQGVVGSADLNYDGQLDLVLLSSNPDNFSIVLGNGDGTFGDLFTYPLGFDPLSGMVMDDLDADGDIDLAIGTDNTIGAGLRVFLGNGDGTFAPNVSSYAGGLVRSVTIADLDHDNILDITVSNWDIDKVSVLLGNGNGTFAYNASYATGNSPNSIAIGDLNGDGNPDIAVGCPGSILYPDGSLSILMGNGNGTFAPAVNYPTNTMGSGPRSLVLGDLDSDGDLDVAAAHYHYAFTSHALVFYNNGDGTFATPVIYDPGTHVGSVTIDDVNGDGILDLAVGRAVHKTTTLLLGNGDGTFLLPLRYATGGGNTFADLDQDGDKDFVGGFQAGVLVSLNNSCAASDLNKDGIVNEVDLLILLGNWGACPDPPNACLGDINIDGTVNTTDLLILFANWG